MFQAIFQGCVAGVEGGALCNGVTGEPAQVKPVSHAQGVLPDEASSVIENDNTP
jgi:hypothetical protein